jgi:hypothetical protein
MEVLNKIFSPLPTDSSAKINKLKKKKNRISWAW